MAGGWIKLHRQILDSKLWEKPQFLRFWMWCLLSASYKDTVVNTGFCDVALAPGQLLYSQNRAMTQTNLSGHYVKQAVAYLKKDGALKIDTDSTNLFSIATIVNWESYQGQDEENNQPFHGDFASLFSAFSTGKNVKIGQKPLQIDENQKNANLFIDATSDKLNGCNDGDSSNNQAFFGNSPSYQELINKQKNAGAHARREESGVRADEVGPSSVDRFEALFSKHKDAVLAVWRKEREAVGLVYVRSPRNDRAAVSAAAMIESGDWSIELIERATKALMASPERQNYTLAGLIENLELWVNGGPSIDRQKNSKSAGSPPSKPRLPAGSRLREMAIAQGMDPDAV